MIATPASDRFDTAATVAARDTDAPAATRSQLRQVLALDGITCIAMGIGLSLAASAAAPWLGLPPALLFWAGIVLFPCAALMLATAAMRRPVAPLVWIVIIGNVGWILASAFIAFGPFEPSGVGRLFLVAQAAAVAVLALLEWRALKLAR